MQLYDGLPLLTAQPVPADKAQAPHRLYGALAIDDICTAVRWRDMALTEIEKAVAEKKLPIVVGGTGFYIRTLTDGISPIPEVPADIRAQMVARQKELGNPAFHAELKKQDPETAEKIDPFNTQRVIRAAEVLQATGKGLAAWQKTPPVPPPRHLRFIRIALMPPREELYARCDQRFSEMLDQGALQEAASFQKKISLQSNTATIPLTKISLAKIPLAKALGFQIGRAHV